MALFFPGKTRCVVSGRVLSTTDEVVMFPPFISEDKHVQKFSDGVADFAALKEQPEFSSIVEMFRNLAGRDSLLFSSDLGAVVCRNFGNTLVSVFPLLLAFDAPEESLNGLVGSGFAERAISRDLARYENYGLLIESDGNNLCVKTCPTKYRPSEAAPNLVRQIRRSGKSEVGTFSLFLRQMAGKHRLGRSITHKFPP